MKITLIREDRESGKETLSTCEADAWIDRIKTETKEEHVTRLRSMLLYTNSEDTMNTSTSYRAFIPPWNSEEAETTGEN